MSGMAESQLRWLLHCVHEPAMPSLTILIIEDDAAIRRGIVDALRLAGYDTLEAATGGEGLDLALSRDYSLLLLDLVLPGPGGMEILSSVRRDRPTVPIIVLTARGDEAEAVEHIL